MPKRAGASKKERQRARWLTMFYALRRELPGCSDFQVCVSVAERDFRQNPGAWPTYARADAGGLRPEDERRAGQRVWAAIQ
jgi:hypothetical protein